MLLYLFLELGPGHSSDDLPHDLPAEVVSLRIEDQRVMVSLRDRELRIYDITGCGRPLPGRAAPDGCSAER